MNFKSNETEFTAKVTLGIARKLKEAKIIDLLDSDAYVELSDILSSPIKSLNLLWAIVKEQAAKVPMTQSEFEDQLDLGDGLSALKEGVENFIQQLGEDSFTRYSGFQSHSRKILNQQMQAMEGLMDDPEVQKLIEDMKSEAVEEIRDGIKSKRSQVS